MNMRWAGIAILLLALAGIGLSTASLVAHYKKSATEYCDLGDNFNCDLVNRSPYSEIARVPVAAIGIAGYIFLLAMSRLARSRRIAAWAMLAASLAGLAFALRLTYVEAYILEVWCILCLGSLAAIFLITVLSGVVVGGGRTKREAASFVTTPQ
jgi:vitamin-K-epoxide reductase (warfarin-sensitive)